MPDVRFLLEDVPKEIDIDVDCMKQVDGAFPTLHVVLNKKAREREAKAFQRRWARSIRNAENETENRPEMIEYAEDLAFVVKDSQHFFTRDGEPVQHTKALFLATIRGSATFALWFASRMQELFREEDEFAQAQEDDDEKNS